MTSTPPPPSPSCSETAPDVDRPRSEPLLPTASVFGLCSLCLEGGSSAQVAASESAARTAALQEYWERKDEGQAQAERERLLSRWNELRQAGHPINCACHTCTELRPRLLEVGEWREAYTQGETK